MSSQNIKSGMPLRAFQNDLRTGIHEMTNGISKGRNKWDKNLEF